jgi:hypothetical protein
MKKLKLFILIGFMIIGLLTLTGCNKDIIDTNYTFTKAITYIGNERIEIEIKKWSDYDGEQIQIIGKDGKTYLVSSFNTILIKE